MFTKKMSILASNWIYNSKLREKEHYDFSSQVEQIFTDYFL
jgi:hypothetical protein